jgi:serine O-acetyltransferase
LNELGVPLIPWLLYVFNRIVFSTVLPYTAIVGKGVLLGYQGLGIVIHRRAVIGDFVEIGSCVTIGGRAGHQNVPVIEEFVMIGTGAKILGPITIGHHSKIGANAVVLSDVPPYGVAVGIPARVVRIDEPQQ